MSNTSGIHIDRRRCRDCRYWYLVTDYQGNCRRNPWPAPRWSETATAHCRDFMHRLAYRTERR